MLGALSAVSPLPTAGCRLQFTAVSRLTRLVCKTSSFMEKTMVKPAKNTICLWYDRDAEAAARFYAKTFPDSSVGAVHRAPGDFPSGKKGDVLTVEFTVMGIPCLGLNGGPVFKHNEAFSFQVATATSEYEQGITCDQFISHSIACGARRMPGGMHDFDLGLS